MSKLKFPKLINDLSAAVIHAWSGCCEDMYETWQALNNGKMMESHTLIMLAGPKMEESTAATWWNKNCNEMKKLTWGEFAQKGSSSFPEFAKVLQRYTINNSILKNHLLFFSHPILCLRISGQQNFAYETMKVDTLIAAMSSTWASLLAEGVVKLLKTASSSIQTPLVIPSLPATSSSSLPTPTLAPTSSLLPFVLLMHTEKEALHAAGGCHHCHKALQTMGWVKHHIDNCPGDPVLSVPPHSVPAVIVAVGPVSFAAAYEEGYKPVAVVMPVV
ncbi:hypothetical protein MVEN_00177600 [Mycena venus]|uniref:Uncharacterized protein n=1 Tax=Mycena venus TaxID=2733690 RepID=A0A8H6YY00_9AGAR|nr:hypothetical protein MVEN_00177600 [Mycena venus]